MTSYCELEIKIEDKEIIKVHYVYNDSTTFDDLIEFLSYYYPDKNICPCFKFKGDYDYKEFHDIDMNWKIKSCINKYTKYQIVNMNEDKQCHCSPQFKDNFKKPKKYIINNLTGNKEELNNIKINKNGLVVGNENLNATTNFVDFYDVIVDIKSIKDICNGWEIKKSKRAEENYENIKKDEVLKVGIIGNSNKGKSFLLSKISKITLPSGTSIRTEGLSIKYPEINEKYKNRKIVLLDSAGLETPVLKENKRSKNENVKKMNEINQNDNEEKHENEEVNKEENEENKKNENNKENEVIEDEEDELPKNNKNEKELFREKSREKLITELFLQNYIIYNSDILIVVVGILTYSEQKLLNKIKNEIQRAKLNKTLFIIHNLMTYTSVKQVEEYIDAILLKSETFNLELGHKIDTSIEDKSGVYYYEKNSDPKIYHFIYANEGSEAGLFYNKFTLDYLENFYKMVTDIKPFDILETVKERFIDISNEIFEQLEKPLTKDNFDNSNEKLIKLKNPNKIILKKCLIDELGFSNLKTNGFEPVYNIYKKDDKLIIRVEASGNSNIKSEIFFSGEYTFIRLSGIKKKDKEPHNLRDNIFNSREFGNYTLNIPIKTSDFLLKNEEPSYVEKKGVLMMEYKLDEIRESKGYNMEEKDEI